MAIGVKNQKQILQKLKIRELNPMQVTTQAAVHSHNEIMLHSPTGTGKTLAFLLPIIAELEEDIAEVQAIIIAPSRELVIQIEQVAREMGTGFKINSAYGGRSFSNDKINLKHRPHLLVATPGRLADHLRRNTFTTEYITTLVLDEYDKSLEIGFEKEMKEIVKALSTLKKKILTSATQNTTPPSFIKLRNPKILQFVDEANAQLEIKSIISPDKDKLETLVNAIKHLGNQPGIIFCNYKDSIQRISNYLSIHQIAHGCFYGGLEQKDRERALIKFRNGTHQLLLATDLAARGIDVPEIKYIIHYHLPMQADQFIHRNGRTARMHQDGSAYVLVWEQETLPKFIPSLPIEQVLDAPLPLQSTWTTLFISGGRKDKISKGDIVGLFLKETNLNADQLGKIELKQDCAFVAVPKNEISHLIKTLDNRKLKKRKIRIKEI